MPYILLSHVLSLNALRHIIKNRILFEGRSELDNNRLRWFLLNSNLINYASNEYYFTKKLKLYSWLRLI